MKIFRAILIAFALGGAVATPAYGQSAGQILMDQSIAAQQSAYAPENQYPEEEWVVVQSDQSFGEALLELLAFIGMGVGLLVFLGVGMWIIEKIAHALGFEDF